MEWCLWHLHNEHNTSRVFERLAQQDEIEGGRDHERIEAEQIHEIVLDFGFPSTPEHTYDHLHFGGAVSDFSCVFSLLWTGMETEDGIEIGIKDESCLRVAWEGGCCGFVYVFGKAREIDWGCVRVRRQSSRICYENCRKATKGIMNLLFDFGDLTV